MVITLSRQREAGGDEIAQLLCQRAGLRLADREAVEHMARREGLPISRLAILQGMIAVPMEWLRVEWHTSVSHGVYLRRLAQVLLALESEDDVLIAGRGAAFVLTDPGTLHVRVIAPMPCRVARLVQRGGLHQAYAQRLLEADDAARAGFVRTSFDADIADPAHYDLTLGTAELAPEEAADVILLAAERKSRRRAAPLEPPSDLLTHVNRLWRRPRLPRVGEATWRHCERRSQGGYWA